MPSSAQTLPSFPRSIPAQVPDPWPCFGLCFGNNMLPPSFPIPSPSPAFHQHSEATILCCSPCPPPQQLDHPHPLPPSSPAQPLTSPLTKCLLVVQALRLQEGPWQNTQPPGCPQSVPPPPAVALALGVKGLAGPPCPKPILSPTSAQGSTGNREGVKLLSRDLASPHMGGSAQGAGDSAAGVPVVPEPCHAVPCQGRFSLPTVLSVQSPLSWPPLFPSLNSPPHTTNLSPPCNLLRVTVVGSGHGHKGHGGSEATEQPQPHGAA